MGSSEQILLVTLMSSCPMNVPQNQPAPTQVGATYGAGTGTEDGACEASYLQTGQSVYDPYPGDNTDYPMLSVGSFPSAFAGEDFELYGNNDLVASASTVHPSIDVTSGALYARHLTGSQIWKRGFSESTVFRMLAVGTYNGMPIRYEDGLASSRVYFDAIHASAPLYTGAHLFLRYQTENDLYVGSLRLDGQVTLKKKICGQYETIAQAAYSGGVVETDTWYDLAFEARGTDLTLYVNGQLELTASDGDLSWGSTGIRLDYADAYLDDWRFDP